MSKYIAIVIVLLFACIQSANAYTVYKKVNKDGSVQYSDKPFPGAIKVKLPPINTQDPKIKQPDFTPQINQPQNSKKNASIEIISPNNGDSIRDNAGNLTIMVQKQLPNKKTYSTQLLINDEPYLKPFKGTVLKLKNMDRGIIKIKVQLQNSSGNVLATSSETVVYMHRASVIRVN